MLVDLLSYNTVAGTIKGKVYIKGADNNANAVVFIEYVKGSFKPPDDEIVMDQVNLQFIPEILPILVGSTVTFKNNDVVLHNVFSPTECSGEFNLGTWPKGQFRKYTFNKANCVITILCNVHPDMQAWIITLQNPYFVKTDSNGNYEIKDLSDGTYTLKVWYPFYKTISEKITIKNSEVIRKDFILIK